MPSKWKLLFLQLEQSISPRISSGWRHIGNAFSVGQEDLMNIFGIRIFRCGNHHFITKMQLGGKNI